MTTSAADDVMQLIDVHKSYGGVPALRGVSLSLQPAQIMGLLGPNGAGKSTLFQIAAGLFAPDKGSVNLFGTSYAEGSAAILSRLGVVFQSRSLDGDISVHANLKFYGGLFGMFGKNLRLRIDAVCEMMDITDLQDKKARKLSGGNQRRVEIARALLPEPRVLLLDEPSAGLDAAARRNLVLHLRRIVQSTGLSVLWATHLVDEVADADQIALLIGGVVTERGTPAELLARSGAEDLTGAYIALTGQKPGFAEGSDRFR